MIFVFDTETTGLPQDCAMFSFPDPSQSELYKNARLVEIACVLYDEKLGQVHQMYSSLVKPDEFRIQNDHIHGITHRTACKYGHSIHDVLENVYSMIQKANIIVAHNLIFDFHILLAESIKNNHDRLADAITNKRRVCTMRAGRKILHLSRFPKLQDLHARLVPGAKWSQSHRALDDTMACVDVYQQLRNIRKQNMR